jgi:type IV pilus assembly protein PilA
MINDKSNKKGFTLIELLAVILILAIIALIAMPVILNIVDESKKGAFKSTADGIIKAGELEYATDILAGTAQEVTFTYTNGVESSSVSGKQLNYKGAKPKSGTVIINSEGQVAIAIYDGNNCAEKNYSDTEVKLSKKTSGECVIGGLLLSSLFASNAGSEGVYGAKNGSNYFSGANPNNWIEFGQVSSSDSTPILWRIIKNDSNGIKLIYEGAKNGSNQPTDDGVLGGTSNFIPWTWSGESNKYEGSDIQTYINNWYNNLYVVNKTQYEKPIRWCIGAHTGGNISSFKPNECIDQTAAGGSFLGLTTNPAAVGMINTSDYLSTALSSSCDATGKQSECKNNNFLYKASYSYGWWTINARTDYTFLVWAIGQYGDLVNTDCSSSFRDSPKTIRPVINLKPEVLYNSGSGTLANPYKIKI